MDNLFLLDGMGHDSLALFIIGILLLIGIGLYCIYLPNIFEWLDKVRGIKYPKDHD